MSRRLSRAEKRRARKEKRQLRDLTKNVRQFASPDTAKRPSSREISPSKTPKTGPLREYDEPIAYSHDHEDRIGQWSWGTPRDWGDEVWTQILEPFLVDCCKKSWKILDGETSGRRRRHKFYPPGTIVAEARNRLIDLEKDEFEEHLFRFRINSRARLYGFRIGNAFYMLWWDPKHMICPAER